VRVEWTEPATGAPWIRGTLTVDAKVVDVRDVIVDVARYAQFMPNIVESEWVTTDKPEKVNYLRYHFPWPLDDRDSVCRMEVHEDAKGVVVVSTQDVVVPSRPARPDLIRLSPVASRWTLTPTGGGKQTRILYEYLGELGGDLPGWMRHKVWNEEPVQALEAVRDEVRRRQSGDGGTP